MKDRYIVSIAVAVVASLASVWYVLAKLLTLPTAGVIILLAPTALVTVLAAIYGYHEGVRRQRVLMGAPVRQSALSASSVFAFAVAALAAGIVLVWLAEYGQWIAAATLALVFVAVLTVGATAWRPRHVPHRDGPGSADDRFEARFRISVFALVALLPVAFVIIFLSWVRDIQEGIVFLAISAVVLPWALYKLRRELHHPHGR